MPTKINMLFFPPLITYSCKYLFIVFTLFLVLQCKNAITVQSSAESTDLPKYVDANQNGLIDISTYQQLDAIRYNLEAKANYTHNKKNYSINCSNNVCTGFELVADIDASPSCGKSCQEVYGTGFISIADTPLYPFTTILEGNNHTISNLYTNPKPSTGVIVGGLFGYTSKTAIIQNVKLNNFIVKVTSSVPKLNLYIGALVAYNKGTIKQVSIASSTLEAIVIDPFTDSYIGGLIAKNEGTILKSDINMTITTNAHYTGGIVGRNYGSVSMCTSQGKIVANNTSLATYTGGIAGRNDINSTILHSINNSTIISSNSAIGGITASNLGIINDTMSNDTIYSLVGNNSKVYHAGLVAINEGSIYNSISGSSVSIPYGTTSTTEIMYAGGLVAYNSGTISNSISFGSASNNNTKTSYVGGFVGFNNTSSIITNSYSTGSVYSLASIASYTGGFIGYDKGAMVNSNYTISRVQSRSLGSTNKQATFTGFLKIGTILYAIGILCIQF